MASSKLIQTILNQRGDVSRKLGTDSNAITNWWNQHGESELRSRLKELGRNDVIRAVDKGQTSLGDWYANWGTKEFDNLWKSAEAGNPYGIIKPTARKAFSEVLPMDKVLPPELIQGLAEGQVMPEVNRQRYDSARQLNKQLASSGAWKTGGGQKQQVDLGDAYTRLGREQTQTFGDTIKNYGQDWYNQQYEAYNKNPSAWKMPELPSFEEFADQNKDWYSAYQTGTQSNNLYENPFKF